MKTSLHCVVTGSGPEIVLLHPVGLDHGFMAPWLAPATHDHRVIALDLPGHGHSPAVDRSATLDDYVRSIAAAMREHCHGPAILLGLSFGGMLAQSVALAEPDRVSALVLCGCPGGFAPDVRPVLRERGLAAERDGMASVVATTIERWFTPPFRSDPAVDRVRRRLLADDPIGWSAGWHAISTFEALPRLADLRVPTLVLAGEQDVATPLAAATTLANAIPGATLQIVPKAPHMMQIECREAFNRAVESFLVAQRSARGR